MVMFLGKKVQITNTFILSSIIEKIRVVRVAITSNIVLCLHNEEFFLPFKHKSIFREKSVPNDQN